MNAEINIVRAGHLGGYRLRLEFDDGFQQVVDFQSLLEASVHPQIRDFLQMQKFLGFRIEHGDLVWGDYDLCFPLTDLYQNRIVPEASSMLAA